MSERIPYSDYVKVPTFEEYSEMFKDYFDFKREDGILQITMKTGDGPMKWSGAAHRACSQVARVISMDHDNEIIIWTHKGPEWMQDADPNGWEDYNSDRFLHQFFDDTNITKNMLFDIDVPTIGAIEGSGFHWDPAVLCDITICTEDTKFDDVHVNNGLVPGDGMGLLLQHLIGTKRAAYYMYTTRMWTAQQALDWGFVSEVVPKGTAVERAWELARIMKQIPYECRTITSMLVKRPLKEEFANNLKLHNTAELLSTFISVAEGGIDKLEDDGSAKAKQIDEGENTLIARYRFSPDSKELLEPITMDTWNYRIKAAEWYRKAKEQEKQQNK